MKTLMTTMAALLALSAPVWAQDTDGDGNVTWEEMRAAYPEVTEDAFATMDTDGDGVLSAAEIQAAVDAGQLPS